MTTRITRYLTFPNRVPAAASCLRVAAAWLSLACAPAQSQDQVIFSAPAGDCALTAEWNAEWRTLRLRPLHPSARNCFIEKDIMASALSAALSRLALSEAGRRIDSLYIGRLIDYPWLSQALAIAACHDRRWNPRRGRPRRLDINAYVAKTLSGKDMTAPFDQALAKTGYTVKSASVEKVLVGRSRDVPLYRDRAFPGLVPYDAQVWFRLERN